MFDVICKWFVDGFCCWEVWGVKIIGLLIFCGIFYLIILLMSCSMLEFFFNGLLISCWFMLILFIGGGRFGCINEGNCGWIVVDLLRVESKVILSGCCFIGKVECVCSDLGGVIGGKLKFLDGKVGVGGVLERVERFCIWRYFCRILVNKEFVFLGNIGFMVDDRGFFE